MTSVVASQISRLGFNVSKEWVDACVEFCQSQSQNLSGQALVNVVIGQWMDADISVVGTQSGPQIRENISPEVVKGPTLQGKFCLQVQLEKNTCISNTLKAKLVSHKDYKFDY